MRRTVSSLQPEPKRRTLLTRRAPRLVLLPLVLLALLLSACGGAGASAEPPASEPADTPAASEPSEPSEAAEPSDAEPSRPDEPSVAPSAGAPSETPAPDELDWTLPPNYGSVDLVSGFTPDPHEQAITSGGPIDASHVGGDCRGFATAAPDFDVRYEAGTLTLLRFYFVADTADDTTLIINAPDGKWYCNDDAPGTIDPMIDFANPASGLYDVWVGSYDAGTTIEGVLHVTELESNRP